MPKRDFILLALEDPSILNLMDRVLRAVGYETATASDLPSLGKILKESSPSLLMISETFSGQQGLRIAGEVQERFPTLPFLFYAQELSAELTRGIFRLGLSGYLTPPLKTDDIVETVETGLRNAHRVGDWLRKEVHRTTASLQKRAQISEAERARLEAVFNNIGDCVMILGPQKTILFVNPAMCRTFDIESQTAVGKPVLEVITHPDVLTLLTRTADAGDLYQHYEVSFPDGRIGNAQFVTIQDVGYAFTMQDITHVKEVDRVRREFVSTVSHDLRSPLTSVLGYTELVPRAGPLNDMQQDFISRIQQSIRHITSLINDLLDIGSVEAGIDTRREFVQLEGILRYTMDMLQNQIQEKEIRIQMNIAESLPAIRGNPIRLRQVLDNVVGNAIKYSGSGGEVTISIRAEEKQVILEVTDRGPGILPADQPHIFDKYYRGSNIGVDVQGSGLGLAIVKNIVENHQGRIWVESMPGKGSSFFIVLPIAREPITTPRKT